MNKYWGEKKFLLYSVLSLASELIILMTRLTTNSNWKDIASFGQQFSKRSLIQAYLIFNYRNCKLTPGGQKTIFKSLTSINYIRAVIIIKILPKSTFLLYKFANATLVFKTNFFRLPPSYIIFVFFIYHLSLELFLESGI